MQSKEIFNAALAVIADPERWTQGESARNESGDPTDSWKKDAVCWCSMGAISAVSFSGQLNRAFTYADLDKVRDALNQAAYVLDPESISTDHDDYPVAQFNDTHSYDDVMRMWYLAGKANNWL